MMIEEQKLLSFLLFLCVFKTKNFLEMNTNTWLQGAEYRIERMNERTNKQQVSRVWQKCEHIEHL